MRVAIIDDDEIGRRNLKALLAEIGGIEFAGEAATLETAVALIDREKPFAVFLAPYLGREDGFEVLEKIEVRPQVVIAAPNPNRAVKGFEIAAVDYLLKPVLKERLARTVNRLFTRSAPLGLARAT